MRQGLCHVPLLACCTSRSSGPLCLHVSYYYYYWRLAHPHDASSLTAGSCMEMIAVSHHTMVLMMISCRWYGGRYLLAVYCCMFLLLGSEWARYQATASFRCSSNNNLTQQSRYPEPRSIREGSAAAYVIELNLVDPPIRSGTLIDRIDIESRCLWPFFTEKINKYC